MNIFNLDHSDLYRSPLKQVCAERGIKVRSLRQAWRDLGISMSLSKQKVDDKEDIDIDIPSDILAGDYLARGRLVKEIKKYSQQIIKSLREDQLNIKNVGYTTAPISIKKSLVTYDMSEVTVSFVEQIQRINLPEVWKDALAKTLARKKPEMIRETTWNAIITQIHHWMGKDQVQLQEIVNKGWTFPQIFGCHNEVPERRYDHMGLLMLIERKTIDQIKEDSIALKTYSGAIQTFRKTPVVDGSNGSFIYTIDLPSANEGGLDPRAIEPLPSTQSSANLVVNNTQYLSDNFNKTEDEYMNFEERAAIIEYDGGFTREEAERLAQMNILENLKGGK